MCDGAWYNGSLLVDGVDGRMDVRVKKAGDRVYQSHSTYSTFCNIVFV